MPKSAFPYPGGKARHADWILDHFPRHECYVEVFGGGAAILLAKDESNVEVYNDADGTVVDFFRAAKDNPDELAQWLAKTHYSRELHEEYNERLYGGGDTPDNLIERAGMFFYLRYTSFGGKRDDAFKRPQLQPSGSWRDFAGSYDKALEEINRVSRRFRGVTIENCDWRECFEQYDTDETLFYCDPPYVGTESYYTGTFDHSEFVEYLADVDGDWVVSYAGLPSGLDEYHVEQKNASFAVGQGNGSKETVERLVMNFDPHDTPRFESANQSALTSYGGR